MTIKKLDPRVKRTNKYLITAIVQLLKEKDINKISVQNITDTADLTRATFYLHYRDKQDFFNKLISSVIEDLVEYVKQSNFNQQDLIDENDITEAFTRLFEYIYKNSEFFTVMLSNSGLPQFRIQLENIVQKEVYTPLLDSRINIEEEQYINFPQFYLLNYITSAHVGVICSWLNDGRKHSPKYMAQLLYTLTLNGVFSAIQNKT